MRQQFIVPVMHDGGVAQQAVANSFKKALVGCDAIGY
jgi:hypothetical protein